MIISALEIVVPGFPIVVVPTVGAGIDGSKCCVASNGRNAPGIIGILYGHITVPVKNADDIPLQILDIGVLEAQTGLIIRSVVLMISLS